MKDSGRTEYIKPQVIDVGTAYALVGDTCTNGGGVGGPYSICSNGGQANACTATGSLVGT